MSIPPRTIFGARGGDRNVRPSHAANAGKIFAWDDPPPTGHPGEAYGCRCFAEPYLPRANERIAITLTGLSDAGPAWSKLDFIDHYYNGKGRGVTIRETGHLRAIVAEYQRIVIDDPLDIGVEIIDPAATLFENIRRPVEDRIRNRINRIISDRIRRLKQAQLGIHTGEPYPITDEWSGSFEGEIYADRSRSVFR